jgi:glycosyltransferase involved in cell wall biosynthesis
MKWLRLADTEIIVVDDESTDDTTQIARGHLARWSHS